jgi:hypothetical protein
MSNRGTARRYGSGRQRDAKVAGITTPIQPQARHPVQPRRPRAWLSPAGTERRRGPSRDEYALQCPSCRKAPCLTPTALSSAFTRLRAGRTLRGLGRNEASSAAASGVLRLNVPMRVTCRLYSEPNSVRDITLC